MSNLLTSPQGDILFLALEKPVKKTKGSDDLVYTVKLAFDNKKDKDFLSQVAKINDAKVVTATTYRGKDQKLKDVMATGKSIVSASSKFKPSLHDGNGNPLEECPYFFKDSTGTAQMIVQPFTSERGGTINLVGVIINKIDTPQSAGTDRESRLAQLRAAVEAATK